MKNEQSRTLAILAPVLMLSGCVAAAAAGAAVSAGSAVVGAGVDVAGAAVDVTGDVVGAAIPGDGSDDEDDASQ